MAFVRHRVHVSRYNYFVRRSEEIIGYNARTGAFALLPPAIVQMLERSDPVTGAACYGEHLNSLLQLGFLCRENEVSLIAEKYRTAQAANKRRFGFTIAPTLRCNYACVYCYEEGRRKGRSMPGDVENAVCRFAKQLISAGAEGFSICWYGGEPLLATDVLFRLNDRLQRLTSDANVPVDGCSIITNGLLLDAKTAEKLSLAGINWAQVSFDAVLHDGCSRRGLLDHSGQPSPIFANVLSAREHLPIGIRINVFRQNFGDIQRMIDILKEHGIDSYSLARTDDVAEDDWFASHTNYTPIEVAAPDMNRPFRCLDRLEFAEFFRGYTAQRKKTGLERMIEMLTPKHGPPCGAVAGGMYVIDPEGNVSRCWNSVGVAAESIGSVLDEDPVRTFASSPVSRRFDAFSPFTRQECVECRVLPLCHGNCCYQPMFGTGDHLSCAEVKYHIQRCVEEVGSRLQFPAHNDDIEEDAT